MPLTTRKRQSPNPDCNILECLECGKKFSQKRNIAAHMSIHMKNHKPNSPKESTQDCEERGTKYLRRTYFSRQKKLSAEAEKYLRQECLERRNSTPLTKKATKTKQEFECFDCGKTYLKKSDLAKHLNKHTKNRKSESDTAKRTRKKMDEFADSPEKRRSTRVVSIRHKTVSRRMTVHSKTGTPAKTGTKGGIEKAKQSKGVVQKAAEVNYKCLLCKKTFLARVNILRHMTIHTQKRKIASCQEVQKLARKTERTYKCLECGENFLNKLHVGRHMVIHTEKTISENQRKNYKAGKDLTCLVCRENFRSHAIGKHMAMHIEKKEVEKSLTENRRTTLSDEWDYECLKCSGKLFSQPQIRRHMRTHTKRNSVQKLEKRSGKEVEESEKSYECAICNKLFMKKCNIGRHMTIHMENAPSQSDAIMEPSTRPVTRVHLLENEAKRQREKVKGRESCEESDEFEDDGTQKIEGYNGIKLREKKLVSRAAALKHRSYKEYTDSSISSEEGEVEKRESCKESDKLGEDDTHKIEGYNGIKLRKKKLVSRAAALKHQSYKEEADSSISSEVEEVEKRESCKESDKLEENGTLEIKGSNGTKLRKKRLVSRAAALKHRSYKEEADLSISSEEEEVEKRESYKESDKFEEDGTRKIKGYNGIKPREKKLVSRAAALKHRSYKEETDSSISSDVEQSCEQIKVDEELDRRDGSCEEGKMVPNGDVSSNGMEQQCNQCPDLIKKIEEKDADLIKKEEEKDLVAESTTDNGIFESSCNDSHSSFQDITEYNFEQRQEEDPESIALKNQAATPLFEDLETNGKEMRENGVERDAIENKIDIDEITKLDLVNFDSENEKTSTKCTILTPKNSNSASPDSSNYEIMASDENPKIMEADSVSTTTSLIKFENCSFEIQNPQRQEHFEDQQMDESIEKLGKEQLLEFIDNLKEHYPTYKNLLENSEFSLQDVRQNQAPKQWRFNYRLVSTNNEKSDSTDSGVKSQPIWKLEARRVFNEKNLPLLPNFIKRIISDFETFLNRLLAPEHVEGLEIILQANFKDEVMALLFFHDSEYRSSALMNDLKNHLCSKPMKSSELKSLYFQIGSKPELLYGAEKIQEKIDRFKFDISAYTIFSMNINGIITMAEIVDEFLEPKSGTTFLEIGCQAAFTSLLLAHKFKKVIGMDSLNEIEEAEQMRFSNTITNVSFVEDELSDIEILFKEIQNCEKVVAVVNQAVYSGQSIAVMQCLRKLSSLQRLVIVTPLTDQCIQSLLVLMKPTKNFVNIFKLSRSCITEEISRNQRFLHVILLERE